jgi:hypothetical protein
MKRTIITIALAFALVGGAFAEDAVTDSPAASDAAVASDAPAVNEVTEASDAPAQASLADNSFFTRGTELQAQAEAAYEEGDYDAAADLAAQAEESFNQSDLYVAKMVKMQKADDSITQASQRLAWAESVGAKISYAKQFAQATADLAAAKDAFSAEDYDSAIAKSSAILDGLKNVLESFPLPAVYQVKLVKGDRECLWKIAALPFIYNDPYQWAVLYKANKKRLVDMNNPNLILPGMELKIPSLHGEKREGTYDPTKKYQPLPKK